MKIQINMVSREVYSFELPLDNPVEFIKKIRPKELFQREIHQILGSTRTVSLNPEYIEWLELDTLDFPTEAPYQKTMTLRQLSPEAFKYWVSRNIDNIKAAMEKDLAQNVLLAYGKASFKSGRSLQFEIRSKLERAEERIKASQKIFNMPALFVNGETSGLFIVNTKNITAWQVVPGLKKSTYLSVPGELTGISIAK